MRVNADGGTRRIRSHDADDDAAAIAVADVVITSSHKRRKWEVPEDSLVGVVFPSEMDAVRLLVKYSDERGFSFNQKLRRMWKDGVNESVYYTCSQNRPKILSSARCSVIVAMHVNHSTGVCEVVEKGTELRHSNHTIKTLGQDDGVVADFLNVCDCMLSTGSSEGMRGEWLKSFPDRALPGTVTIGPYPFELDSAGYQWMTPNFYVDRFTSNQVIKPVVWITAPADWKLSSKDDSDYFAWWLRHTDTTSVVTLRVPGVSAVDLQMSLMYFQQRFGVLDNGNRRSRAHRRHAVFPSADGVGAMLAINVYALRSYRMITGCHFLKVSNSMPAAPLLLQGWAMRPTNESEQCARRMGMFSTLLFLGRFISDDLCPQRGDHSRHMHWVDEPQFELYDYLPEFLRLLVPGSDADICTHLYQSTYVSTRGDGCFSAFLASFIFQKEDHYMREDLLTALHDAFTTGTYRNELRRKYPHALAVIVHMHDRMAKIIQVNERRNPIYLKLMTWNDVELIMPWMHRPGIEYQPQFYLYQMCFDDEGFLDKKFRQRIARGIFINSKLSNVKDEDDAFKTGTIIDERSTMLKTRHEKYLKCYSTLFEKPVAAEPTARMARFFAPFSTDKSDLWPLNGLFTLLKTVDHLRRNKIAEVVLDEDDLKKLSTEQIAGTLFIGDAAKSATRQINWPVACSPSSVGGNVFHFEDTLWVYEGSKTDAAMTALEACLLVRDPCYYFQKQQKECA